MDVAEWNSGNARHSAERARDQLVERTCSLPFSVPLFKVHRLNQCPV